MTKDIIDSIIKTHLIGTFLLDTVNDICTERQTEALEESLYEQIQIIVDKLYIESNIKEV